MPESEDELRARAWQIAVQLRAVVEAARESDDPRATLYAFAEALDDTATANQDSAPGRYSATLGLAEFVRDIADREFGGGGGEGRRP